MRWNICGVTDQGQKRARNEDAYEYDEVIQFGVVCDGVGGNRAGHIASGLAAGAFGEYLTERRGIIRAARERKLAIRMVQDVVAAAIVHANRVVWNAGLRSREWQGMATTLVGCVMVNEFVVVGHAGDSRAYQMTLTGPQLLTRDHNVGNENPPGEYLDPYIRKRHAQALCRAVGLRSSIEPETQIAVLGESERLLLCTDGMWADLHPAELAQFYSEIPAERLLQRAVKLANRRGGSDNITGILIESASRYDARAARSDLARLGWSHSHLGESTVSV